MTTDHPSLDTIADYCAALLPAPEAESLAGHLSHCSHCAANAVAIHQVPTILSGAADAALPMPESVARAIDDALRSETKSRSSVVDLAGRRTSTVATSRASRLRRPLLAAAAAVVAVAGIAAVVDGLRGSSGGSAASSAADSADSAANGGQAAASAPDQSLKSSPRALSPQNLSAYADRLTRREQRPRVQMGTPKRGGGCAAPRTLASDIAVVRRWETGRVVVVVHPDTRRVTVLDCRTASTELYSTSY